MNTILLVELFLKSTAFLVAGFCAAALIAKSSAAHRSLMWLGVFAALLFLPLAMVIHPVWTLPVTVEARHVQSPQVVSAAAEAIARPDSAASQQTIFWCPAWSAGQWLLACYLAGIAAVLGFRLIGSCQLQFLCRGFVENAAATGLVNGWSKGSQPRCHVRVFTSARVTVPMTWGVRRPVIVLPDNHSGWTEEMFHAALRHECAHIRHGDAARRWLGTVVSALWWPHPLVWAAFRRWKLEQERACDDAVLTHGGDAADYAQQLIGAARNARLSGCQSAAALIMAGPSGLETRLRSVLNGATDRSAVKKGSVAGVGVVTLLVAIGGVALQAQSVPTATGEHPVVTGENSSRTPEEAARLEGYQAGYADALKLLNGSAKPGDSQATIIKAQTQAGAVTVTSVPGSGASVATISGGSGTLRVLRSGASTQSTANPPVSKQVTVISQTSAALSTATGQAATASSPGEPALRTTIITVDLQDVPVAEALQYVGKLSGIKVRYAAPANDNIRVTMSLKDIPVGECIRFIANIANLTITYDEGGVSLAPKN